MFIFCTATKFNCIWFWLPSKYTFDFPNENTLAHTWNTYCLGKHYKDLVIDSANRVCDGFRCIEFLSFAQGWYWNFPYQIVKVCLVLHWNSCWEKWQKDNMHGCMISLVYCHKTCMCNTVISAEHSTIFLNDLTVIIIKWARQVRRMILTNQYVVLLDQPILFILNCEKYQNDVLL